MGLFLSAVTNRIDKKGRVSVPADFRAELKARGEEGLVVYRPLSDEPCIEACDMGQIERLAAAFDRMDPFDPQRMAFETEILGGAKRLSFDGEGRVLIPEELAVFAGLADQATFVGKGQKFQIWEPERFADYRSRARELAVQNRSAVPWAATRTDADGGAR